ncbi:unnamed protein product [Phytomonas sp. Hart1]|nr:unnamed protein product [Phytomonas sp. Hart1]|eukprot:CCW67798.1 unnamed protein product [Phytomonas sp. isolate Hart1]
MNSESISSPPKEQMFIPDLPDAFIAKNGSKIEDVFENYQTKTKLMPNNALMVDAANSDPAEAWVKQELPHYESQFTKLHDLHVCLMTFNVASKKPTMPLPIPHDLHATAHSKQPTDLVVFAFQEIDMGATAMFREETEAALPWVAAAQAAINADRSFSNKTPYYAFPHKQLVGLLLCVFIRRTLLPNVTDFALSTVATGALGSIGNKGGIGAHLVIHCTSFCIITAHLAAGVDMVRKRNDDINTILRDMNFNAAPRSWGWLLPGEDLNRWLLLPDLFPRDHDIILVTGDLNYRVNLTYEESVGLANRGEVGKLLEYDQLIQEMKDPQSPWTGFRDLTPTFLPTYRFNIGTSTYDTSGKRRVPSYTDRICVWTRLESMQARVKVDSLRALTEVRISDHKPVQAQLRFPLKVEVPRAKTQVIGQLRDNARVLGLDCASCTHIAVSPSLLDFETQKVNGCERMLSFRVTNTGPCAAVVRILRQCPTDASDGTWLRVVPLEFVLVPEQTQKVKVTVQIQPGSTPWLSRWMPFNGQGQLEMSSILMVCVRNGSLAFVECKTVFKPSIIGNSLRNIFLFGSEPCAKAYRYTKDRRIELFAKKQHIPKELWYLINVIVAHPCLPGLFTESSKLERSREIIDDLDSLGVLFPDTTDPHSAAECLLKLLHNLQEPVIPFGHYEAALCAGEIGGKAPLTFLSTLPMIHANVFIYIMGMLNFLLRPVNARSNGLSIELVAQIFSNVLIAPPLTYKECVHEHLRRGGGVDQRIRRKSQIEKDAAQSLLKFFLNSPPTLLQY